jgi:hypothetical protein
MFRNAITKEVVFEGTPDEAWGVLTDFTAYPAWNPGFVRVEGRPEVGTRLDVTFAKDGGEGMTMHPTVLAAEPGRALRWRGRLFGIPFLFDGEHAYGIEDLGDGRVRLVQSERFVGLLVPFLRRLIEDETATMFERINRALAERVVAVRNAA